MGTDYIALAPALDWKGLSAFLPRQRLPIEGKLSALAD